MNPDNTGDYVALSRVKSKFTSKVVSLIALCICIFLFARLKIFSDGITKPSGDPEYVLYDVYQQSSEPKGAETQIRVRLDRPVTVVTAYYGLPSSSNRSYLDLMKNFLPIIPCHLYIYTDAVTYPVLESLREEYMAITKFVIGPLSSLKMAERKKTWELQKRLHGDVNSLIEKYILRNEKANFVMDAVLDNAFDSDFFVWTDIDSFGNPEMAKKLVTFPNTESIMDAVGEDQMFFLQKKEFSLSDRRMGPNKLPILDFSEDARVSGSVFGGHAHAWTHYTKLFYETMDLMRREKRFIGNEENIISTTAVMFPGLVHTVQQVTWTNKQIDGAQPWFFGLYYLANTTTIS